MIEKIKNLIKRIVAGPNGGLEISIRQFLFGCVNTGGYAVSASPAEANFCKTKNNFKNWRLKRNDKADTYRRDPQGGNPRRDNRE
jgi:hypothetical protein